MIPLAILMLPLLYWSAKSLLRFSRRRRAHRNAVVCMEKLQSMIEIHPVLEPLSARVDIIRAELDKTKPRISEEITARVNFFRAMAVLFPYMVRAKVVWNAEPSMRFISERYPLEWRRAVALCPDLEAARRMEK